jgi:hypothetical protein
MNISDDEIRKTLQVLLSDKSKLLVLSQLIDTNLAEREKEIADSQKRLQSESRTIIGKLIPNAEPYLRLQENMTTIYANMNRDVRFLRMMIEAIALNNTNQPEPEHIDAKAMVTEEHKKILNWFHKYMEHLIGEGKAQ